MYNPFSYLLLFFNRLTETNTDRLLPKLSGRKLFKNLLCLLLGCCSVCIIIQWNTVPVFEEEVSFQRHMQSDDSTFVGVTIFMPYESFSSYAKNKGGVAVECSHLRKDHPTPVLPNFNYLDSLAQATGLNLDSVMAYYELQAKMQMFSNILHVNTIDKNFHRQGDEGHTFVKCNRETALQDGKVCDDFFITFGLKKKDSCERVGYEYYANYTLASTFDNSWVMPFRMTDISQRRYNIKVGNFPRQAHLTIDFGGPVELAGIFPEPDQVYPSRIVYTSPEKIRQIGRVGGLDVYCRLLETESIQNVRTFLLSTVATLFIGIVFKVLGEWLFNCLCYSIVMGCRMWRKKKRR